MTRPRIAVTGVGVVCAIGNDTPEFLIGLRDARAGIQPLIDFDPLWAPCGVGGEVTGFAPELPDLDFAVGRAEQFTLAAAGEALEQAGLGPADRARYAIGVSIGTCQTTMGTLAEYDAGQPVDLFHQNSAADALAAAYSLRGPRFVPSNACAAGGTAIAMARDQLWDGTADVMLAGGADAFEFFTWAGFSVLQSLDVQPCSPYGRSGGLTIGEGAAVLVLERYETATERGARVIVELAGAGGSADGYHPTAPDPTGRGAALAMQRALRQAGIDPDAVDYVNGHGTGTPANDAMERAAFRLVLGDRARTVPVSSTKSQIGHTLGAAGAIEAAACILAIDEGFVPPTLSHPGAGEGDFDFVPNASRPADVTTAVSNNYAFGGSNASLVFTRPDRTDPLPALADRRVLVTGLGAVGGPGEGIDAWWQALVTGTTAVRPFGEAGSGRFAAPAPVVMPKKYASRSDWRKMNEFSRLGVVSARLAWNDAQLRPSRDELDEMALIFATATGSMGDTLTFDRLARRGAEHANPNLFPNVAFNSPAGHMCTVLGIHGPTMSITQGGTSALAAFIHGTGMVQRGEVDVAMVVSSDAIFDEMIDAAYEHVPEMMARDGVLPFDERAGGIAFGTASVAIVLESAEHATARGARPYAEVLATSFVGGSALSDEEELSPTDWIEAMTAAVDRAGLQPGDIGFCAAAAGGINQLDRAELEALSKVFGASIAVSAPKGVTGECLGSTTNINVLTAALAMANGVLPPVAGLEAPLPGGSDRKSVV